MSLLILAVACVMLLNGAKPSCAHYFSIEREMTFCQPPKFYERKYEILKTYRVCYDNSINQNISDLKTLSVTNPLIRYEIIFIITQEKKSGARREPTVTSWWAHCVFTVLDQNAEPWPSREFTEIKMLIVTICFLVGFPQRSGSACILFCSIRNWLLPFGSKSHLPQIQSS